MPENVNRSEIQRPDDRDYHMIFPKLVLEVCSLLLSQMTLIKKHSHCSIITANAKETDNSELAPCDFSADIALSPNVLRPPVPCSHDGFLFSLIISGLALGSDLKIFQVLQKIMAFNVLNIF